MGDGGGSTRQLLQAWLTRQGVHAEFRETHSSVVAIASDRVFKMKKAVKYPFLNLSTPELRQRVCRREVELNSRLAPDVYVGVVDITDDHGRTVDHAVEMVRLPDRRRLDQLVADGDAAGCLQDLAGKIASFHRSAVTSPEITAVGSRDATLDLWRRGLRDITPFVGDVVPADMAGEVERLATRYLAGRGPLFADRMKAGRIRDGHGDLRTDDVFCLPDGLRVIDCLEFDDRLRWGDVLADVAFLAMDLEWLGHPELAQHFLASYRVAAEDHWPSSLEHHWIAYRAHVRARVACLRPADDPTRVHRAQGHLRLALRHLQRGQVRLVLIGGLPGTGKTTLARALADETGLALIRTDVVRRALFGAPRSNVTGDFETGVYAPAATEAVYDEALRRAADQLAGGMGVIVDASWSRAARRAKAAEVARVASAELIAVECHTPAELAEARVVARHAAGGDESDADAGVARRMAGMFAAWPQAHRVDTSGLLAVSVRQAKGLLEDESRMGV